MEKKSVLGKGLSALIPDHEEELVPQKTGATIKVKDIQYNALQPRLQYAPESLAELKNSIQEKGVLQPILVRHKGEGFEVVAGERRLRAAQELGFEDIPAVVRDVSDEEALVLALVENIQREELNAIEEARAFKRLIDEFQFNQEQIAGAVGKDRSTVSNLLRLLKLPENIQKAVGKGWISMGHARTLLSIDDAEKQYKVFWEIMEKGVSVRQAEQMTKANISDEKKAKKAKKDKDHEVVRLEEELRGILGTKVLVDAKKKRGKIVIEYYSFDDLDRILGILRN